MDRPKKIYREEPVKIAGIEVRHTYAGLIYLIEHYGEILAQPAVATKVNDQGRQHIQWLVGNYNIHLQLLQNEPGERGTENELHPGDIPAGPVDAGPEEAVSPEVAGVHNRSDTG